MIIERVIKECTAIKIFQYLMLQTPELILKTTKCSTGGEYDYNDDATHLNYRVYKSGTLDSGVVISNMQSDRNALMSLNTIFYHHSNANELIIYGSEIDSRSTERYSIDNKNNFKDYQNLKKLQKTIDKHGNTITYSLVLNSLCRDMNLDNFKVSPMKITEFLNDCLGDNWYNYYKGIL